jgi:hypothetical protein
MAKEKETFTCEGRLELISTPKILENGEVASNGETDEAYRITAIIGDRFMNGGFFPAKELQRVYKKWEGTKHDINHFGTSYPAGFFSTSNILYFVGYHKNVKYNSVTKEVSMDIEINPNAMYADAWKAYVDICKMSNAIPNVSVTYLGKQEYVLAKNLPKEANWKAEGYTKDDLVPVLSEVEPVCVSTVVRGRCDDKDGCGMQDSCSDGTCDVPEKQDVTDALEKERLELIKYLKDKDMEEK